MSNPQKRKGDKAELEAAALLTEHTGQRVRRKLGAGRTDDEGDIEGLDGWTIEVKNYRRHTKRGEPPCDACREAKRAGRRSRYLAS